MISTVSVFTALVDLKPSLSDVAVIVNCALPTLAVEATRTATAKFITLLPATVTCLLSVQFAVRLHPVDRYRSHHGTVVTSLHLTELYPLSAILK